MRRHIEVTLKRAGRKACKYNVSQPAYRTFIQGDYASTLSLAIRTGIVCPILPLR